MLVMSQSYKCSRCGREALVIRKYSGEALCADCLRKSLMTKIRRTISKYRLLERVDSLTYLSLGWPYESTLADMFLEIESNFDVEVRFEGCEGPLNLSESIKCPENRWDRLIKALRSFRYEKAVIPLLLDDVVALYLRSIFLGPSILVLNGRLYLSLKETKAVAPFSEIPMDEILSLHLSVKNYEKELVPEYSVDTFLLKAWELEKENPGMRYSFYKAIHRLGSESWTFTG